MYVAVTVHGESIELPNVKLNKQVSKWLDKQDEETLLKFDRLILTVTDDEDYFVEDIEGWTVEWVKQIIKG